MKKPSMNYVTGAPTNKDVVKSVTTGTRRGKLAGRAPHHMKHLMTALHDVIPPEKGTDDWFRYRHLVTDTLAALIFHLTSKD